MKQLRRLSPASIGASSPALPYLARSLRTGGRDGSSGRWHHTKHSHAAPLMRSRCSSVRARVAAERVVEAEAPAVEQLAEEQGAQGEDKFVWTQCWWPVMTLDGLDPKIPRHVDLLGKSLVVWADSKGAWHCFEDVCPHRLAPLSEGRVEGDSLMCSYHGWTFNGQGACDSIPQIPAGPARTKACSDRKACARAYPTAQAKGLLWVWPESGPQAAQQAERTPIGDDVASEGRTTWNRREIPTRVVTQLENVFDPSHVPFAHHGVLGNRYKEETHVAWSEVHVPEPTREGGVAGVRRDPATGATSTLRFKPPYNVSLKVERPGKPPFNVLQLMVVPSRPGFCTFYGNGPDATAFLPEPRRTLHRLVNSTPWGVAWNHLTTRAAVVEGDMYLLHVAERLVPLDQGVGVRALKDCYMPGRVDTSIIAFRQWLSRFGGDVPTCTPADAALEPPLMTKEQVLDRYHSHTKDCVHCKRALATIDTLQPLATALSAMSAFVAVAAALLAAVLPKLAASPPASAQGWWQAAQQAGLVPAFVVGLVLALVSRQLHKTLGRWRQSLFYEEYVHALRD